VTVSRSVVLCRRIREMEVFKVLNEMKAVNIGECIFNVIFSLNRIKREKVRVIVFNATFNNISACAEEFPGEKKELRKNNLHKYF
jgi:hypothetical protein